MLLRFAVAALIACPLFAQGPKVNVAFSASTREVVAARLARAPETNADRAAGLRKLFEEAGCKGDMLREQAVKGARQPNVICSFPGQTGSTIVTTAYLDFSEKGKGVIEDWSGAALLPSLFEALQGTTRRHSFVFIGFTDKQRNLRGSSFYVKSLSAEEKSKIKAMISLDSLGLSPSKVQVEGTDKDLSAKLASIAKALSLKVTGVNNPKETYSDAASFGAKIPTIMVHSLVAGDSTPGSARDTTAAVNMNDYYDTYRLVAGYLVYLDQTLQ
jgi:hypothetical protein